MTPDELAEIVLQSDRFHRLLNALAIRSVLADVDSISPALNPPGIDWDFALLCSSALTRATREAPQDAALRVTQGCLAGPDADVHQREAAAVLLERMGNLPAVRLAASRDLVASERGQTSRPRFNWTSFGVGWSSLSPL